MNIELSVHEVGEVVKGLMQTFVRYEEICERQLAYDKPYYPYIESLLESMKKMHDLSLKIGEALKKEPYVNIKAVDDIVSMDGAWENRIKRIREKIPASETEV